MSDAGVFGSRVGWGQRPGLLVVDVMRAYLEPDSPLYAGVEDARASAARVVDAARAGGVPVVFTRVAYGRGCAEAGYFAKKVPALHALEEGSPLSAFPEAPAPAPGEVVITKHHASAFFGTILASLLVSWSVDTAVVVGFSTSGCVRASAVDALQHGFRPIVVRDAVGDRTDAVHEANLFDLGAKYADVVDEAEAVGRLAGPDPAGSR